MEIWIALHQKFEDRGARLNNITNISYSSPLFTQCRKEASPMYTI
jgi:hypothetical protein